MSKEFEVTEEIIDTPEKAAEAYRACELAWGVGIGTQMILQNKEYDPSELLKFAEEGWKLYLATLIASHQARQKSTIQKAFGLNVGGFEERLWGSLKWSSQKIDSNGKHSGTPVYIAASQVAAIVDGEYKILLPEVNIPALNFEPEISEEKPTAVVFDPSQHDPRGTL